MRQRISFFSMALRVSSLFTTHTHHPLSPRRTQKNMTQTPSTTRNDSPPRFAPLTRQLSGLGAKLGNVFGGAAGGSAKDDRSSIAVSDSDTLAGGEYLVMFLIHDTFLFLSVRFLVVVVGVECAWAEIRERQPSRDKLNIGGR